MNDALYQKVSEWFEEKKPQMIEDIKRLVRFPSIADLDSDVKPYGKACRDCLEEMLKIGQEHGFYTENYENYCGSIGAKEKNWDNLIGFWNHLDVVPTGQGWKTDPFTPEVRDGFLFGRGSQDNKGPAIGILYVMQCIRELEIPMKHELCMFVGTEEEKGMSDLEYYCSHYPTPKISMIADSGFPVCYGEKGILEGKLQTEQELPETILSMQGGSSANMVPDWAEIVFAYRPELEEEVRGNWKKGSCKINGQEIVLRAKGTAKHSAFPEGSQSAFAVLFENVLNLKSLTEEEREILEQLFLVTVAYHGENLGIAFQDEVSGKTTCVATILETRERKAEVTLNIRYAITMDQDVLEDQLEKKAKSYGMQWIVQRNSAPNYFDKENPIVKKLTDIYNEITGEQTESFTMGGGTYARKLPNAFAYGIGGMRETEEEQEKRKKRFPKGHGGAHEPDEALHLRPYFDALKIYVMALCELNDCEL